MSQDSEIAGIRSKSQGMSSGDRKHLKEKERERKRKREREIERERKRERERERVNRDYTRNNL